MPVCSKSQAFAAYQTLPEKFRSGMVGRAMLVVLGLLNEDGYAPLDAVLDALFPSEPPAKARTMLATQIVNRPFSAADGTQPLQLKVSRKLRSAPNTSGAQAQQKVWFESATPIDYASFGGANPRYQEAEFVAGQALQATAQEQLQSLSEPYKAAASSTLLANTHKAQHNHGRQFAVHGLLALASDEVAYARAGASDERFIPGQASSTQGFSADALTATEPPGKKVDCLAALLDWACNPNAQRLVAVLGDYGTGKTSHTQQLAHILNGQSKTTPQPHGAPRSVYVDLAQLAGAERLNELNLLELLTLALNKQRTANFSAAEQLVAQARAGEVIFLYDGFDELIKTSRDKLHHVLQQLLMVLQPGDASAPASRAKVLLSCRTHYFRDAEEQIAFFNTRARGAAKQKDYLCLTLLPWDQDNIEAYLGKHLSAADSGTLLDIINNTYNLTELASRPVLLAMMSEQVGELLRKRAAGEAINAAELYGITVAEWVQRDNGKHHIQAAHKPLVMGALACAQWNSGQEVWSVDQLDRWIVQTLPVLYPGCYDLPQAAMDIQNDLRTATFIVRPGADQFNFAHKSFQEYFVARFVWDCLVLLDQGALSVTLVRELLPRKLLNTEAMNFLREWWEEQAKRSPELAKRCAQWVWALMQDPMVDDKGMAPQLHESLFQMARELPLACKTGDIFAQGVSVNLRGLSFHLQRWRGLNFSYASLDLQGSNFVGVHAWNCNFGPLYCNGSNWAQTVLRDCDIRQIDWGDADRGGQIVRYGKTKQPQRPLRGPWTRPTKTDFMGVAFIDGSSTTAITKTYGDFVQTWDLDSGRPQSTRNLIDDFEKQHFEVRASMYGFPALARSADSQFELQVFNHQYCHLYDLKKLRLSRVLGGSELVASAAFDSKGNLVWYSDEAADTWLFCLATGKPEPVEMAEMVEEGYSAD